MTPLITIAFIGIMNVCIAQPKLFNYQGVARSSSGSPIASQPIGLKISILDSSLTGTVLYSETHHPTTNSFGLYNVAIGGGTVVSGSMASINWGVNDKYVKVEMDASGGTSYVLMGTTQLLSVPYALYAANTGATSGMHITAFQPSLCAASISSLDSSYHKIKDIGMFSTYSSGSKVEITLESSYGASSSSGVVFELRVDGTETTVGKASVFLSNSYLGGTSPIIGVFSGLPIGTHTLSVWVRAITSATIAYIDNQCLNYTGTNNVIIKEYQ